MLLSCLKKGIFCNIYMFRKLIIIPLIIFISFKTYSQTCYKLDEGKELSLFSPFLGSNPRVKKHHEEYFFGDTARNSSCNNIRKKSVIGVYDTPENEPVFAAHGGTVSVYTSVNASEGNQVNDALWIDGGNITTNYIGLIPSVETGQYVYAGQLLGKIFRDKFASVFGFGIRHAPPLNPIHKRGYLPVVAEKNNQCECNREPLWPEYFVNPASKYIAYDRYNDFFPDASLRVNIEPGGIGQWSFDNGVTWLPGGAKIAGLPFGFYKIIFKNNYGYTSPSALFVKATNLSTDFETTVKYVPDYTILKKPEAELQRETDQKVMEANLVHLIDSAQHSSNTNKDEMLRNSIIDSLNNRFTRIETIQKETFFFTKLFKYILPVLLLALSFMGILLFQNNKIRKQKKYLENLQKEQHHRVHNSLGVISSLLNKYKENIDPEKLANIDNSIVAISTVHRQLYKGSDIENICFQPVAENIAQSLLAQRGLNETVKTFIDADVIIPQKKSTTLALIFNELFTNSLKYAFEHTREKMIFLTLSAENDHFLMVYRDNGSGYPIDFLKQKSDGFGRILLEGLSQQLRAKLTFYNEAGACCMIKF